MEQNSCCQHLHCIFIPSSLLVTNPLDNELTICSNKLALCWSHSPFVVCYCCIGVTFESNLQLICRVGHQVKCVILVDWTLCYDLCGVTDALKLSCADVAGLVT